MSELEDFAAALYAAGCCVLPAANDGTKRPAVEWKLYETERPAIALLHEWIKRAHGIGVVCGAVSEYLEMIEFEARAVAMVDDLRGLLMRSGYEDIWSRLWHGYREETPSGGLHLFFRTDGPSMGNTKLARRPATDDELNANPADKVKVMLETRGEGGWVVTHPSHGKTHATGKSWRLLAGGPDSIPTFTLHERAVLYALARSLDQMPSRSVIGARNGDRPGDAFNNAHEWPEILEPHGWLALFEQNGTTYWRRPGKADGISATTNHNGSGLLWVFSTSTAFESERSYDRFGAFAQLNYEGDLQATARALAPDPAPFTKAAFDPDTPSSGEVRSFTTITREVVEWLWPKWLPRGKLTMLDGDPALGKSTVALDIAARISSGGAFPDGTLAGPLRRNVMVLTAEDGLADTVLPRFIEAGGDPRHAFAFVAVMEPNKDARTLVLPNDLPLLERLVVQHEVALVIVDVLVAYLAHDVNSHNDASMRGVLMRLAALAEHTKAAIVCLRHLNKSPGVSAMYRGGGSIGIIGAARAGWIVTEDPRDVTKRVIAVTKSNLAEKPSALSFSVVKADGWDCARIAWHGDADYTADQLVARGTNDERDTKLDRAELWLLEMLGDGPQKTADVYRRGEQAGFSEATLRRARQNIKAVPRRYDIGEGLDWYWTLPDDKE